MSLVPKLAIHAPFFKPLFVSCPPLFYCVLFYSVHAPYIFLYSLVAPYFSVLTWRAIFCEDVICSKYSKIRIFGLLTSLCEDVIHWSRHIFPSSSISSYLTPPSFPYTLPQLHHTSYFLHHVEAPTRILI
jgi:hypothetical protein